jgi:hypothetical protein
MKEEGWKMEDGLSRRQAGGWLREGLIMQQVTRQNAKHSLGTSVAGQKENDGIFSAKSARFTNLSMFTLSLHFRKEGFNVESFQIFRALLPGHHPRMA